MNASHPTSPDAAGTAPPGSPSASSARAGSAPRSPPRCSSPGTARSPPPGSPTPPGAAPPHLLPDVPLVDARRGAGARRPRPADRPRRRAARPGRRARRDRRRPARAAARAHLRAGTAPRVLDPALRAGALPLALHPAMTFTGTPVDVQRLAGCSFGVTAPEELRLAAEALVIEMGGEPEWIAEERPAALPRGPRARRQPPGHPGRPVDGAAARGRRRARPTGCSARCSAPPSTTPCAPATRP